MYKNTNIKPYLAAIFFTVITGFSFLSIKACQPYADQLQLLTHRYNFAFIAVVIVWFTGIFKSAIKDGSAKGKSKKMLLVASISYIMFMMLQIVGIFYTTSVVGSIIFAVTPILVQIIASVFLKEKGTCKQNFFVVLTVVALVYMVISGATSLEFNWFGVICIVLSSFSMAISNTAMRYVRIDYRPFDITMCICTIGFVLFNIVTIILGIKNGTLDQYLKPLKHPTFVFGTAYLGIGCILLSSQLISYMLSRLPAVNATIFGNVGTAISIVAGIVILDEPFYMYHLVCTILIIIGAIGVSRNGHK